MAKFIVLIVMIFLAVMVVLANFNSGSVELTVWKNVTHEISIVALILASTGIGILMIFIIYAVRDARRYFDSWQLQRQHKKESKIQESYSKGLEALFASKYEEAKDLFTHVTESEPVHSNALLRLGDISYVERDYPWAKGFYLKAMEVKARSVEVLLSLVKVAEVQQNWQEALKYLDSILEIDEENKKILHKKREIYEINKNWEELIEVQNKLLKSKLAPEEEEEENKRLTGYKYELSLNYIETGSTDKAIKSLKAIMKSDDSFLPAYIALADAYIKEGNTSEAADLLLKGYETTQSLVILTRLEDHYISEGEPGTIIDLYQKAVQKNPNDVKLRFFLAKLYYRLEMIDHVLETVNAIDPAALDFPGLHLLLAGVYERRSENEKALDEYKNALKINKPLVVPYCCSECSYSSMDWSGRCPECDSWNSFILDINEACEILKRQSSS